MASAWCIGMSTPSFHPRLRQPAPVVVDVPQGKRTKPRGQGVVPVVIWYAQCALERDRQPSVLMHVREAKYEAIPFECDHGCSSLPFSVSNLAHHAQDGMGGRRLEGAQQFSKQRRPPPNHLLEVIRDLAGQG